MLIVSGGLVPEVDRYVFVDWVVIRVVMGMNG